MSAAERHLHGFLEAATAAGLAAGLEKKADFLKALAEAPASRSRCYWLARVTLVSGRDEIAIFDALFDAWFGEGGTVAAPRDERPQEETPAPPAPRRGECALEVEPGEGTGRAAALDDLLHVPTLAGPASDESLALARLTRQARALLPRRTSRRLKVMPHGEALDLRHTLRRAARCGGEVLRVVRRGRPERLRPLLVFVDVSGSLKALARDYLIFARALLDAGAPAEVLTFGTRLTRVTRELGRGTPVAGLARAAPAIRDWNGGTRIGASLAAFLADPRLHGRARGAAVLVLSDGLERGDPSELAAAVRRLRLASERLVWLTPLKRDAGYQPLTRGMAAIARDLDAIEGAASLADLGRSLGRWTRPRLRAAAPHAFMSSRSRP